MTPQTESDNLLGCTLVVIAVLAITEGRPDYPSATVVAAVTVVSLACFGYLAKYFKLR